MLAYRVRQESKFRDPAFKRALAHIAYRRAHPEVTDAETAVFVRDRGAGFDPEAVPSDRKGIAESIKGRLERAGGSAVVTSSPGGGTEGELRLPR